MIKGRWKVIVGCISFAASILTIISFVNSDTPSNTIEIKSTQNSDHSVTQKNKNAPNINNVENLYVNVKENRETAHSSQQNKISIQKREILVRLENGKEVSGVKLRFGSGEYESSKDGYFYLRDEDINSTSVSLLDNKYYLKNISTTKDGVVESVIIGIIPDSFDIISPRNESDIDASNLEIFAFILKKSDGLKYETLNDSDINRFVSLNFSKNGKPLLHPEVKLSNQHGVFTVDFKNAVFGKVNITPTLKIANNEVPINSNVNNVFFLYKTLLANDIHKQLLSHSKKTKKYVNSDIIYIETYLNAPVSGIIEKHINLSDKHMVDISFCLLGSRTYLALIFNGVRFEVAKNSNHITAKAGDGAPFADKTVKRFDLGKNIIARETNNRLKITSISDEKGLMYTITLTVNGIDNIGYKHRLDTIPHESNTQTEIAIETGTRSHKVEPVTIHKIIYY